MSETVKFQKGDWVTVIGLGDHRHRVIGVDGRYMAIECLNGVSIVATEAARLAPQHDISESPAAQIHDVKEFGRG